MRYRDVFLTPGDITGFTAMTTVTFITIGNFEYATPSFISTANSLVVSLQGKPTEYVPYNDADNADAAGKYTINTMNQLILIAGTLEITDSCAAGKYVSGIKVHYLLKPLTYADNIPTYNMKSYNVNNYLVTASGPAPLNELLSKVQCLDKNQDVNAGGYLVHVITRNMT